MKYLKIFSLLFFNFLCLQAQDSLKLVNYNKNYNFNDGIFMAFEDVLTNTPINKSNIITELDKNSYDFYDLLPQEKVLTIMLSDGQLKNYNPSNIWGYAQNGKLNIYWEKKATLIPIIGSISHFIGIHEITQYAYTQDAFGYSSEPNKQYETVQYIIDFSNGLVYEFNIKNIDPILATDEELYQEWINLSKRKRKKLIFVYLQKFNERNPLMLPSN